MFCLAEGPSKEAVESVHRDAHGFFATSILELDPAAPLNALFGAISHHPSDESPSPSTSSGRFKSRTNARLSRCTSESA